MVKTQSTFTFGFINLERQTEQPLYFQVYEQIRNAILKQQLMGGYRLPSTRSLAGQLSVSRNTVLNAYEQLEAEGYIDGKPGDGSYVSKRIPEDILKFRNQPYTDDKATGPGPEGWETKLSDRGSAFSRISILDRVSEPCAFRPGIPALDQFPYDIWQKLMAKHLRHPDSHIFTYGSPGGYIPLRKAIAGYLGMARGVRCNYEQVIIVSGTQQGMTLAGQLLMDRGESIILEDPCYPNARRVFSGTGSHIIPVPVDQNGLDINLLKAVNTEKVRMVYITPSHQYPLGVHMSISRRLEVLEWARQHGIWVLEDDYDSEYRFSCRPLVALQGLDQNGQVLYMGTFSKVLFPSIRIGYVIVPEALSDPFTRIMAITNRCVSTLDQAVLTDFMEQGHFARHLRRMRMLYAERQSILVDEINSKMKGFLDLSPSKAGLHVIAWLNGQNDQVVSDQLSGQGIVAPPYSMYSVNPVEKGGLVLGYAGINEDHIKSGVSRMVETLGL